VSFSVPVRAGERILGVLTMSLTASEFSALAVDRRDGRRVLLVDNRPDSQRRAGLVLFDSSVPVDPAQPAGPAPRLYLDPEFREKFAQPAATGDGTDVWQHRAALIVDERRPHVSESRTTAWQLVTARREAGPAEPIGWNVVVEQND